MKCRICGKEEKKIYDREFNHFLIARFGIDANFLFQLGICFSCFLSILEKKHLLFKHCIDEDDVLKAVQEIL